MLALAHLLLAVHAQLLTYNKATAGPISFCGSYSAFTPDQVVLAPDPPRQQHPLEVYVSGSLSRNVTTGAKARITVKLGFIQLLDATYDACDQMKQVDLACPLGQGRVEMRHTWDIPAVPPGHYRAHVVVSDELGEIACIDADLHL